MARYFEHNTTYFWEEGKANLRETLRLSFEAAKRHEVGKIVIFTAIGDGVKMAVNEFLSLPEYAGISLVAVTFPHGQRFASSDHPHEIAPADCEWLKQRGVPLVRAHLPFTPIRAQYQGHGVLGQDSSLIGNVLGVFGGSMSLCVQAALMACDAGAVDCGEHVIALTSDTSILVRSAPTADLLTDFIVREIFCKSVLLTISKSERLASSEPEPVVLEAIDSPKLLDEAQG